jgi:hypothetical protein
MAEPLGSFEVVLPLKKAIAEPQAWADLASSPIGGLCDVRLPPMPKYGSSSERHSHCLQQRVLSKHVTAYDEFVENGGESAACIKWLLDNS